MVRQEDEAMKREVADLQLLNQQVSGLIADWVAKETRNGISPNTKLFELTVFNFKLIYSNDKHSRELKKFFLGKNDAVDDHDNLVSRIQDLYITICSTTPRWYVKQLREVHQETVKELGYDVPTNLGGYLPYAWLLDRIQFMIRYQQPDNSGS